MRFEDKTLDLYKRLEKSRNMMKKNILYLCCTALIMLSISACKKNDQGSGTKAVFSYVADGFNVNFTNFSRNAST